MTSSPPPIRVKIIHRGQNGEFWSWQSPDDSGLWGACQFICDKEERDYNWLLVIDDISRTYSAPPELLACPNENTIFVTSEPSSITRYGRNFTKQFNHVITSQEATSLPHPHRIHSQSGNLWYYGKKFNTLKAEGPIQKPKTISTVCSSKKQGHTLHARRYDFTQWLKTKLPELEIYGHGVRYVDHKYDALDAYKFHLAIENHIAPHHWTEKLADSYLAYCVPIYSGCPNAAAYFPSDSFIPIDLDDYEGSFNTIHKILNTPGEYERRLDAVIEARHLVMYKYNLLEMVHQLITQSTPSTATLSSGKKLHNRKQMRIRHFSDFIEFVAWKSQKTQSI